MMNSHIRLFALCVGLFALNAQAALTARNYVQDGLVAHYDGIENVAYGSAHSASATTWSDLTGNGQNIALPTGAAFANGNALATVRANGTKLSSYAAIKSAWGSGAFTFEAAYDMPEAIPNASTGWKMKNVAMMGMGDDDFQIGLYLGKCFGISTPDKGTHYPMKYVEGETNVGKHSFSCRFSGTSWWVDADASYSASGTCAVNLSPSQRHGYSFNRQCYYDDNGLAGEYYSLRIYSRALTDVEMRVNNALDRVRYFGEEPTTCSLPDGWRFVVTEGDTNLEHRVTVGAGSAGSGTVSVNGGAAAESESTWLSDGGSWTVTATATAAEGYEFVCWAGEVADEDLEKATVTATITKDLRAVFRKSDGSAPLTYTWSGKVGDWASVANWRDESGVAGRPLAGDSVVVASACEVLLSAATPHLKSVEIQGTLMTSNWETKVWADSVTVAAGGKLTCAGPFTGETCTNRVWVVCGDLTVAADGQIDVARRGFAGGLSTIAGGYGPGTKNEYGIGPSHGGVGACLLNSANYAADPYDRAEAPVLPGSGGKAGYPHNGLGGLQTCPGGGAVRIEASGRVVVNGSILADGRSPYYSSTDTNDLFDYPGSGGSVWITCETFAGTNGVIRANGGGGNDPREPQWLYARSASSPTTEIDSRTARSAGGGRIAISYDAAKQVAADVSGVAISAGAGLHTGPTHGQTYATMDRYFSGADCGTVWFTDTKLLDATIGKGLTGQIVNVSDYTYDGDLTWTDGHVRFATTGATVRVTGSLWMTNGNSRLEVGGCAYRRKTVMTDVAAGDRLVSLTIDGDCTLVGGARIDIRSAAKEETSNFETWGGEVVVKGALAVEKDSSVYAWCDALKCTAARFTVGSLKVAEGGLMSSERRGGAGAVNNNAYQAAGIGSPYGCSPLGRGLGLSSYYHYAGNHVGLGGVGTDYVESWVKANTYDNSYFPTMAGAGGGAGGYGDGGAGGGVVYVESAGAMRVDGEINADGGHYLKVNQCQAYHGGGAGGTIFLRGSRFEGGANARLTAKGGAAFRGASSFGGAGAGGCIAVWTGEAYPGRMTSRVVRGSAATGADFGGAFEGTCDVSAGGRVHSVAVVEDDTWGEIPDYAKGADGTIWFCHVKKPGGTLIIVK